MREIMSETDVTKNLLKNQIWVKSLPYVCMYPSIHLSVGPVFYGYP